MADEIARWDPTDVVARAKALIQASNYEKVAEARKDVDDTLARWVATVQAQSDLKSAARGSTAVVALWRQYAALEMELRQFKQATKVFERAADCPVAGSSTALWLQYADFCIQRKKLSNARKIFVRALKALPEREQATVWMRFHGFVQSHVDPKLTLSTLQHQVLPEKFPAPAVPSPTTATPTPTVAPTTLSTPTPAPAPAVPQPTPSAPPSIPSTLQPHQPSTDKPPTAQGVGGSTVALVDPVMAFIDKTGEANATRTPSPLAVESVGRAAAGAAKRGAVDPRVAGAKRLKQDVAMAAATPAEPTAFFQHVPQTLPSIPTCPHLLFDVVADGETQKQIGNELLERLSDVLGDSAVFEGVRDLRDNQRTRDREMLYRWQELVSMQMKEGSELFARHVALEMQHGFSDPRGLIALKTQHLEQRREFANRCQMSQQQFIEICAMDRVNALKAQQISLENMKIPELTVTADPEVVSMQRAIVGLILEAEKLWREENPPPVATSTASAAVPASKKVLKTPPASSATPSRPPLRRRESQDSTTSSQSASRSSSGGGARRDAGSGRQGDARGSRGWGASAGAGASARRRDRDPRTSGSSFGSRGRSKWDVQPQQSAPSPAAAAALSQPSRYDRPGQQAVPRLQEQQQLPLYDHGPQRLQPAQQQQPRHFQQQQQPYGALNAPYDEYGGRQGPIMPEQQGYGPPASGAYFAGPQDGPRHRGDGGRFVEQGGPSRAGAVDGAWPQQQPFQQQQPMQHRSPAGPPLGRDDFRRPLDPSMSRYGAGAGPAGDRAGLGGREQAGYGQPNGRHGGMPAESPYYQELPLPQLQYQQQQQQPPSHRENYTAYSYPDEFAAPPGAYQQRGGNRPMAGGPYGPVHQQPPPQEMMPRQQQQQRFQATPAPAMNKGFGGRSRRGGGRYGRR